MEREYFPILLPYSLRQSEREKKRRHVPWGFIAPHEAQALRNHGQTLKRLAERGGLSSCEMLCVLQGRCWSTITEDDKVRADELIEIEVNAWAQNSAKEQT